MWAAEALAEPIPITLEAGDRLVVTCSGAALSSFRSSLTSARMRCRASERGKPEPTVTPIAPGVVQAMEGENAGEPATLALVGAETETLTCAGSKLLVRMKGRRQMHAECRGAEAKPSPSRPTERPERTRTPSPEPTSAVVESKPE